MQPREAIAGGGGDFRAVAGEPPVPPHAASTHCAFCPRCTANLAALPPSANFCNRCGLPLPRQVIEPAGAPQGDAAAAIASPPADEPFQTPLILLAYARALFNLGNRYETAIGSRRNLDEAARCYWKAARLGDAAARQRVDADRPGEGTGALSYTPPPLPDNLIVHDPSPPFAAVYRPGAS